MEYELHQGPGPHPGTSTEQAVHNEQTAMEQEKWSEIGRKAALVLGMTMTAYLIGKPLKIPIVKAMDAVKAFANSTRVGSTVVSIHPDLKAEGAIVADVVSKFPETIRKYATIWVLPKRDGPMGVFGMARLPSQILRKGQPLYEPKITLTLPLLKNPAWIRFVTAHEMAHQEYTSSALAQGRRAFGQAVWDEGGIGAYANRASRAGSPSREIQRELLAMESYAQLRAMELSGKPFGEKFKELYPKTFEIFSKMRNTLSKVKGTQNTGGYTLLSNDEAFMAFDDFLKEDGHMGTSTDSKYRVWDVVNEQGERIMGGMGVLE